ncbi:hypothetical protein Zmor_026935 [Zophobas morio]|uniref:Uncharacterized protein n=1 Tax=Zophobas morio TaxID=2755281 RepID=A0AA38HVG7_9CUCU|nr:hypothetical protein Zmor_026935 [Zophobas morio]
MALFSSKYPLSSPCPYLMIRKNVNVNAAKDTIDTHSAKAPSRRFIHFIPWHDLLVLNAIKTSALLPGKWMGGNNVVSRCLLPSEIRSYDSKTRLYH